MIFALIASSLASKTPAIEVQAIEMQAKARAALQAVGKGDPAGPARFQLDCEEPSCVSLLRSLTARAPSSLSAEANCELSRTVLRPGESCVRLSLPAKRTAWSGTLWRVTVVGEARPVCGGWRWNVRYVAVDRHAWVADPLPKDVEVPPPAKIAPPSR
ncbi:hypothetical protein [Caulobacter endophyticus]|uniref:hypothetical protein n=1 Tax=Caulobacter endophyticus TaxID=2172652 RepID=UPI00240FFE14|nr:hypothetical protein [Caulobacter endophyticus]MDG2528932.1 hypothetical protein [Caulobacter endophyticus]